MISSTRIQDCYDRLYSYLREYLWDFNQVEDIVDLELECYKCIPDVDQLRYKLAKVKTNASFPIRENDEGLIEAFDRFEGLIEDEDQSYKKLLVAKEVLN